MSTMTHSVVTQMRESFAYHFSFDAWTLLIPHEDPHRQYPPH